MSARIRSLRNGSNPVNEASRNDLVTGDTVTVISIDAATTYSWELAFTPEGSLAAFSGSSSAISPGDFTVDIEGPYLVRLVTDLGLPTESEQFVRLRSLTTPLGLKLVAAGEKRDSSGIVPVDASAEGWANDQNFNLTTLESAIQNLQSGLTQTIKTSFLESGGTVQFGGTLLPLGTQVLNWGVKIKTPFTEASQWVRVGWGSATPDEDALVQVGDVDTTESGDWFFAKGLSWNPSVSSPLRLELNSSSPGALGEVEVTLTYVTSPNP